jgi:hypothetical protein
MKSLFKGANVMKYNAIVLSWILLIGVTITAQSQEPPVIMRREEKSCIKPIVWAVTEYREKAMVRMQPS